jgi:hypothetical protein
MQEEQLLKLRSRYMYWRERTEGNRPAVFLGEGGCMRTPKKYVCWGVFASRSFRTVEGRRGRSLKRLSLAQWQSRGVIFNARHDDHG